MAAYQTVYTQTHRYTHIQSHSYMICRHINTEMTTRQTYTTEK